MTAQTETKVTKIEITFDPTGDFGEGDQIAVEQNLNADASRARYDEILTGVLQGDYPGAEVDVRYANVSSTQMMVDTEPAPWDVDTDKAWYEHEQIKAQIRRRYEEVFEGKHGNWATEA